MSKPKPTQEHNKHKQKQKNKGINNNTNNNTNNNQSNMCNLAQIHNAFQIHGDISDKDLENINSTELKSLRERFIDTKSNYEYQRFLQHSSEND